MDEDGNIWVVRQDEKDVLRWGKEEWVDMGLKNATYIAAGKKGQVYALAAPEQDTDSTIYQLSGGKFVALSGKKASSIAISRSSIYIQDKDYKIFESVSIKE